MAQTVCVTGASGFLGLQLVKQLLEKGYTVHATVRDPSNESKTQTLRKLGEEAAATSKGKLLLFKANLLQEGSFDEAVKGCACVFHTASPFYLSGEEYTRDHLVKPAVGGTLNVLKAAKEAGCVKRVVLTSSTAAVYTVFGKLPKEHVFTEADRSDEAMMEEKQHWYSLSKTLAEKAATEFASECAFDLSIMNPTLIWGPILNKSLNTSSAIVAAYVSGKKDEIENSSKTVIDVRDCAAVHIAAWEAFPQGEGRHLMIAAAASWEEICGYIAVEFPQFKDKLPTRVSSDIPPSVLGAPSPHPTQFDCTKVVKLLGRPLIGWKDMVKETVNSLIEHKFV